MKKIMVELSFDDNFVPPDNFEGAYKSNNWNSPCEGCPFYRYDDDSPGDCNLLWACGSGQCPIKKYFTEGETING